MHYIVNWWSNVRVRTIIYLCGLVMPSFTLSFCSLGHDIICCVYLLGQTILEDLIKWDWDSEIRNNWSEAKQITKSFKNNMGWKSTCLPLKSVFDSNHQHRFTKKEDFFRSKHLDIGSRKKQTLAQKIIKFPKGGTKNWRENLASWILKARGSQPHFLSRPKM